MHHVFRVLGVVFLFALPACQRAHTDFDPGTDFSVYKTFSLVSGDQETEAIVAPQFPEMVKEVAAEAISALKSRGFLAASPEQADLLVTTHIEIVPYESPAETHITDRDIPSRKLGPVVLAPYSVTQIDDEAVNRQMQEGTILLNITDFKSGELIWQGWISKVFDLNKLREKEWNQNPDPGYLRHRQRAIQKAVESILADFPPEIPAGKF